MGDIKDSRILVYLDLGRTSSQQGPMSQFRGFLETVITS